MFVALLSLPLCGQGLPDAPKPHLDKWDWSMLSADMAVRTMDTITTRLALTDPCHCYYEKTNFRWVVNSTPRLVVYDVAVPVIYWSLARSLTRHRHQRLAHIVAGFDLVYDGSAVAQNLYYRH